MQDSLTDSESSATRTWWPDVLVGVGLVVGVFLLYAQCVDHEFIAFDDDRYIYDHPMVAKGLSSEGLGYSWSLSPSSDNRWDPHGNWHPLTWMSLMADSQVYGAVKQHAGGHVMTNVALHAVNAVLLFLILRCLSSSFWLPATIAAIFAFHPLRVEAVAWACQRKEVLSSLFGLAAILFYVRYARAPSWGRYGLVACMLALSMASKQTLVALPVGLLLLDWWPLGRLRFGSARCESEVMTPACGVPATVWRAIWEKVPLLAICALAAFAAFMGVYLEGGTHSAGALSIPVRTLNAAIGYVVMLGNVFWPSDLAILYPHAGLVYPNPIEQLLVPGLASIALLLLVTTIVIWQARRRPYLAFGWLWYIILFLPMSGLSQAGYHAMADRFTYIPCIGIYVMVGGCLYELAGRYRIVTQICAITLPLLLVGYAAVSYVQIGTWQNTATAFERALAVTSRNYLAHYNLGVEYVSRAYKSREADSAKKYFQQAEYHFEQACEIYPELARHHVNLGMVYRETGRREQAVEKFKQALQVASDGEASTRHKATLNLGLTLAELGDVDQATPYLRKAVTLRPNDPGLRARLAELLYAQGETEQALANYGQALEGYRRLRPSGTGYARAALNLAWILATSEELKLRDGGRAVELAEEAIAIMGPVKAESLDTLAAAYAEVGDFSKAVTAVQDAIKLLQGEPGSRTQEMRERLKLYEAGQPYRHSTVAPAPSSP